MSAAFMSNHIEKSWMRILNMQKLQRFTSQILGASRLFYHSLGISKNSLRHKSRCIKFCCPDITRCSLLFLCTGHKNANKPLLTLFILNGEIIFIFLAELLRNAFNIPFGRQFWRVVNPFPFHYFYLPDSQQINSFLINGSVLKHTSNIYLTV